VFRNSTNRGLAAPGADNWSEVEDWVLRKFRAWKKR